MTADNIGCKKTIFARRDTRPARSNPGMFTLKKQYGGII